VPFPRASGILLHPTSLPGPFGIGDLGPEAYRFVEFLAAAGQRLWQVLPLNPTGQSHSPYQCYSSFAGNPLLISPQALADEGLLTGDELGALSHFPHERVDFAQVEPARMAALRRSFERWRAQDQQAEFLTFCAVEQHWLDNYALFMAIKQAEHGAGWQHWHPTLVRREPAAVQQARQQFADEYEFQRYLQFQFRRQWSRLKRFANEREVQIIGDMPIFVAGDSADVWANPELFFLDEHGRPTVVAGVPPDYFSATGQRWGNPLYKWQQLADTGYAWFISRVQATLWMVDILRIDHFRGFESYWVIPADQATAIGGHWQAGPGARMFRALQAALGHLPIIAEDLGIITPEVEALRDELALPGMRILQFAFDGSPKNPYLPHRYVSNTIVYTGTHDNDTTLGWWQTLDEPTRQRALRYTGGSYDTIVWDLIRTALASVADLAVIPLQDALEFGSDARMNTPGVEQGNWSWRARTEHLTPALAYRLRELAETYGRLPAPDEEQAP
jgi:4-alpha-glucanotransferase